jgi:MoaA/NifB/PqqE/SkfB family radical SAM enzyme
LSPTTSTEKEYLLYESPLLRAAVRLQEGKVLVDLSGPFSLLPAMRSAAGMIDGQMPALAGGELCLSTWLPPAPSPAFRRFAASQVKAIFGVRTPDQVTISITEECPNRCLHCALPDSGRKLRLPPDAVLDLIGQILDMGTTLVIFDGGEPTLYRELPDLVREVDQRAVSTLFTSGAGFSLQLARSLKEAGLYAVNVSLDSPVAEEHDAMRGREGAFRDAMQAAENALSAGLLVDIYAVLRHQNVKHLEEFHGLARRAGAHELTFFEVVPTGRWANKSGVTLSEEDYHQLEKFVQEAGPPRIFSVPHALKQFGCFAGRRWMHIAPSGEVYPCACMPEPWGSIFKEPIREIWQRMGRLPYRGERICPMRRG